ncbi:MAG: ABC transporter ATP-binding protein [Velocimicrobium sp.]
MINVEHVSCGYDSNLVIKDISFTVKENEILCVLGPNGCGKTTLLRAISGLLPATGMIQVNGIDLKKSGRKDIAKKVAVLNQLSNIYFSYTVYETVKMARYVHQAGGIFRSDSKEDKEFVYTCLKRVGMLEQKDCLITELSGGQLQRVFLARVLAQDPEVILLDEPTNHLDLKYQIELLDYIKDWAKKEKRCVIGVLHDINHALMFADKIMLLENGKIKLCDNVEDFDLTSLNETYGIDVASYMVHALKRWS